MMFRVYKTPNEPAQRRASTIVYTLLFPSPVLASHSLTPSIPPRPQRLKRTQNTLPQRRPLFQLPIFRIPLLIPPQRLLVHHAIHLPIVVQTLTICIRMVIVDMVAVVRAVTARVDGWTGLRVGYGYGDGCGLWEMWVRAGVG
jgi:hypothetical protein